jgi:hypothetical protein
MQRLAKAHKAHLEYQKYRDSLEDSDDDDGPQNEDAWLMEDLKVLAFLHTRLRDRELLIGLIYEVKQFFLRIHNLSISNLFIFFRALLLSY